MEPRPVNLTLHHLQHIGIPVTNLDVSRSFYEKLGFEAVMVSGFDHESGQGTVAMMQQGTIIIEIYQMPNAALAEVRNRKNGHIDHVAFDVSDIGATYELLVSAGFQVVEPAPVFLPFWEKGCKYFNILGPDGERLEFNQIL